MVVLNKIYTRTGDDGTTALGSGERRKKYDLRIAAYGTLDETNAAIGVARLHTAGEAVFDASLARIQNDLFDLGADLCTPGKGRGPGGARLTVTAAQVAWLESEIDRLNAELAAAALFHPAGRLARRRPICISPAPCAAALSGSSPSSWTSRTRALRRRCCNTSIDCPISCSWPRAMPTTKARATCCGSRGENR